MTGRALAVGLTAAAVIAIGTAEHIRAGDQAAAPTSKTWSAPRTPWGDPDIQGIVHHRR